MKILIVTNSSAGLYNFRRMLIREFLKEHVVVAYTPFNGSENELQELGCQIYELELDRRGMNPFSDQKFYRKLLDILKLENPDIVITYTIKPNIYASLACKKLGIPYAANITGLGTAFEKGKLLEALVVTMYKSALKKAKVVFFENDFNRQFFISKHIVPESRTCLLMGAGVDLEWFYYQPYPKNDCFRFIFIGRIMKEKGIDELFSAMERLHREGRKVVLDVCGNYEENYKDKIEQYTKIGWLKYHGRQADVRPFIAESDCFVLPSYHEGMANVMLESSATGRPVITTRVPGCQSAAIGRPIITSNIPGCREAVVDSSGLLCEPKNVDSLYATMKQMTEKSRDEREQMGRTGRKHMEDVFDKRKVVAETICEIDL